ncbi:MAG: hypothetical protein ACYS3N_07625 [Planctomycetota bacterium]|jgi:hypothetical protein
MCYSPEESQILFGMTATDILFGRATAMIFGYNHELGHATIILICIIVETIMVLLFYPLFVFSWQHLLVIKWLKNTFDRIHIAAEAHKDTKVWYHRAVCFRLVTFLDDRSGSWLCNWFFVGPESPD